MKIKITIKDDNREISISTFEERIDGIIRDIKRLLIAWGFHPDTVNDYFND